jgi:hypothetical protein
MESVNNLKRSRPIGRATGAFCYTSETHLDVGSVAHEKCNNLGVTVFCRVVERRHAAWSYSVNIHTVPAGARARQQPC